MRLVDADEFEQFTREFAYSVMRESKDKAEVFLIFADAISHAPTAYDIDKVVEEIEEKLAEPLHQHEYSNYYVGLADALDIVKQGGIV